MEGTRKRVIRAQYKHLCKPHTASNCMWVRHNQQRRGVQPKPTDDDDDGGKAKIQGRVKWMDGGFVKALSLSTINKYAAVVNQPLPVVAVECSKCYESDTSLTTVFCLMNGFISRSSSSASRVSDLNSLVESMYGASSFEALAMEKD